MRLVALAEVALLARDHFERLEPDERRRLVEIVGHGRRISAPEREELRALVGKLDMRAFAGTAASRLGPMRLPKRFGRRAP